MHITRSGDAVRMRFPAAEGEILVQLLGETAAAMRADELDPADPVARRLFPAAYPDDPDAEIAFRELTVADLRSERVERAVLCSTEIAAAPARRHDRELLLDDDAAQRWMRALNDVRLALGTRLEITEDDEQLLDPDDPDAGSRAAYLWLTAVQDGLVHALLR